MTLIQKEATIDIDDYIIDLSGLKAEYLDANLEDETKLVSCIENALGALRQELEMLINIKENEMSKTWDNLRTAQAIYYKAIKNPRVAFDSKGAYLQKWADYEKLLFPLSYAHRAGIISS